ncbi:hypothetical protein GGR51DRAFT_573218 [Nemania sp. FL0031]|nr:hypothetical protein GGR51DRAFT_573218 [Nemania sp. FL0031]
MTQKKQVNSRYNGAMHRMNPSLHHWYCCNCGDGPYNARIHEHCMSCHSQRCIYCGQPAAPVPEIPIHLISFQNLAALRETSNHVPHNIAGRAATPSINTGSTISNITFANSPSAVPYSPEQPCFVDIGTSDRAQSEAPAQHSNEVTSQQQSVGRYEDDLVPVHTHGSSHHSPLSTCTSSHYHTGPHSLDGSPEHLSILDKPVARLSSGLPADHSIKHTADSSGFAATSKPNHGVASNIAINTPTPSSETGSVPILPSETLPGVVLLKQTEVVISTSTIQRPVDSQSHLAQSNPQSGVANDDYAVLPPLQIALLDHNSPEPPVSSAKSPKTPKKAKTRKVASKHYECCKSSDGQRLACPFYKYNPQQHMACISKAFDCIGRLGQHLKQSHKLGPDRLPKFSKMRVPADKKWYWGWKELFGEAVAQPKCPFSHPVEDLFRTQNHSPGHEINRLTYVGLEWPGDNGSPNQINYADSQLSVTPGRDLVGDINLLNIAEGIPGLPLDYVDVGSNYPDEDMSSFPESWNFDFD